MAAGCNTADMNADTACQMAAARFAATQSFPGHGSRVTRHKVHRCEQFSATGADAKIWVNGEWYGERGYVRRTIPYELKQTSSGWAIKNGW
jgi:hypothetical protein